MKSRSSEKNWDKVQSIVSRYYGEWTDTSYAGAITTMLPSTALLGNGDVGVTSYGNDTEKIFLISKSDFWTYKGGPILIGGVSIRAQSTEESNTDTSFVSENAAKNTCNFHEKQDILRAEIQTTQQLAGIPVKMKTWLSADKNIMVTELLSLGQVDGAIQVTTWASDNNTDDKPVSARNDEETVTVTRCTINIGRGTISGHVSQAALATKIIGADEVRTFSGAASGAEIHG